MNQTLLVTGGAGFFGDILLKELLARGNKCINIDLQPMTWTHPLLDHFQGDIRDQNLLKKISDKYPKIDVIYHCAAMLAHEGMKKTELWSHNVDGTASIGEFAKRNSIPKVVFISSNCLWAENFGRPVTEEDIPAPVEIYGKSKAEGEKILLANSGSFETVVLRVPTIIDAGRLGLLSILFQFIEEGRKVWVVGSGKNQYQFIYGPDLAKACMLSARYKGTSVFNIGSDRVKSLAGVYQYVIQQAKTKSRIAHLPKTITLFFMKVAYKLGISPLGPYHYKMIAEDFIFDTTKAKKELGWQPTLTNEEMLWKGFNYYSQNKNEILSRTQASAHRRPASMGVIRILKWLS